MLNVSLQKFLLIIFFIFMPFAQALTFDIGFPLKISEISMICIIFLYQNRVKLKKCDVILICFMLIALLSFFVNMLWEYNYTLNINYTKRFGENIDSFSKFIYLFFIILSFIILRNVFDKNKVIYIKYFFLGAVLAIFYSWYLTLSGVFYYRPLLLFGIGEPQVISFQNWTLIRSGTFLEGNYMGVFIFISVVLSLYYKRIFLTIFFTVSMITTFSTIGLLSLLFFYSYLIAKINIKYFIIILIMTLFSFTLLSGNKDFNEYVLTKINIFNSDINNNGAISREERKESIIKGINMAIDNPFFGVGTSNYAKHFDYYDLDKRIFQNINIKVIPNNIYVEIISELGFIAFSLFIIFLYKIYRLISNNILMGGFLGCCLYFNALPSYTIIVIWFFFAFLLSKNNDNPKENKYVVC